MAAIAAAGWQFREGIFSTGFAPGSQDVTVIDGDTIWLRSPGPVEKIRIIGLDAPETYRAKCDGERQLGLDAKARLEELLSNADWSIARTGRIDKYGRTLARVVAGGRDVAHVLISEGYARPYTGGGRRGWCP